MEIGLDYGEIEQVLEQIMGRGVSFEAMVAEAMKGGNLFSPGKWLSLIGNTLLEQLRVYGRNMGYLILLILSAAMLSTIAKAFKNRQISDMGFYMISLLLFLIVMTSFGTCYQITRTVIVDLIDFMKVLMPAYLMAAAASAYRTSAVIYYEGFLFLIYYLQKLVLFVLLPAIRCYVLFAMLGNLGKEEFFVKGREGLKRAILFLLKSMIGVSAGVQMIQGMITPAIDQMRHTTVSKGISSLGHLGNVAQNVTDIVIGSGALIKGGIGAVAAVLIVSICLIPVIQVGGFFLFYQILAAVSEPISDKRFSEILCETGEGMGLLVKLLFTVCAMFLLTIAIICVTTGGVT